MRRNMETTYENFGNYTTDLYTEEAIKIIQNHNHRKPLFLTVSHTAVHSANPYSYLQAPDEVIQKFSYIKDVERRKYAAMVYKLDESCGRVVKALEENRFLDNTIIIFTSDNGGPAGGFNNNAASNWPLRSVKNTLWEGGVRGAGLIWSPSFLSESSRVSTDLIHIQDWLPTLLDGIGGLGLIQGKVDGISQWESLNSKKPSQRQEILHNIDDIYGNEAIRFKNWKLLHGTTYGGKWDGWYSSPGYTLTDLNLIIRNAKNSIAGIAINNSLPNAFKKLIQQQYAGLFNEVIVNCNQGFYENPCNLTSGEYCLFDIEEDPCERNNIANDNPEIVSILYNKLQTYRKTMVPPINKPKDPKGHPKYWGYTWTNWMDYIQPEEDEDHIRKC